MNDVRRMSGLDGRDQRVAVQRVGHRRSRAQRAKLRLLASRTGQRCHVMTSGNERAHEGMPIAPVPPATKTFMITFLSRTRRSARPDPASSVTASSTAVVAKAYPPLRIDVRHVIRAGQHEVVHESEDQRTSHCDSDQPAADSPGRPGERQDRPAAPPG